MGYYVRKISRPKWPEQYNSLDKNEEKINDEIKKIKADAITNCIKTSQNRLSLWKVENENNSIEDIVPLLLGFTRPDTCDVVYISDELLSKEGIMLEKSVKDANVPIEEMKNKHYNAVVNDYEGLGKFAKVILESLNTYKRFRKGEIKDKLNDMLDKGEISPETISETLYSKIKI